MVDTHIPVLLTETLAGLNLKPDGFYVDATFGRGGHAQSILQHLSSHGRLLVLDQDPQAIAVAQKALADDPRVTICHAAFADLATVLQQLAADKGTIQWQKPCVHGVLFDLGVSSPQLDDPQRGFSFMQDGPLDMRMNTTAGVTLRQYLAQVQQETLADVLYQYGDERHSRRIARAIIAAREQQELTSTAQLAAIIKQAHPAWTRQQHPATRSFQALRIVINQELQQLTQALAAACTWLVPGGRLVVISFHSLEDRIVKQYIRQQAGGALASGLPDPAGPTRARLKKCAGLQRPQPEEVAQNPRARSARLRVAEKLT